MLRLFKTLPNHAEVLYRLLSFVFCFHTLMRYDAGQSPQGFKRQAYNLHLREYSA